MPALTVALAGQPNVGKSTVFNMLTGLSQHVGNWPGKTVEQKTGVYRHDGVRRSHLVDLPGTYSLTANSEEERIARDYLIREQPDVVIADRQRGRAGAQPLPGRRAAGAATCRWWSALNMSDVAEQHGIHVEPHVLEAALGVPVVPPGGVEEPGRARAGGRGADSWPPQPDGLSRPTGPTIRPEHRPVLEPTCSA